MGTTGFVLVALAGLVHNASADMMMSAQMLCVFLTFAMVHPAIRNASKIAFGVLILLLIALIKPSWTHTLLLMSGIWVSALVVWDRLNED